MKLSIDIWFVILRIKLAHIRIFIISSEGHLQRLSRLGVPIIILKIGGYCEQGKLTGVEGARKWYKYSIYIADTTARNSSTQQQQDFRVILRR